MCTVQARAIDADGCNVDTCTRRVVGRHRVMRGLQSLSASLGYETNPPYRSAPVKKGCVCHRRQPRQGLKKKKEEGGDNPAKTLTSEEEFSDDNSAHLPRRPHYQYRRHLGGRASHHGRQRRQPCSRQAKNVVGVVLMFLPASEPCRGFVASWTQAWLSSRAGVS